MFVEDAQKTLFIDDFFHFISTSEKNEKVFDNVLRHLYILQSDRNFGLKRSNLYDDVDGLSSSMNFRHIRFDF